MRYLINFKELVQGIVEADKSKFCRVSQQAGEPGKQRPSSAGRIPSS